MDWRKGLSEEEARRARIDYGPNEVKIQEGIRWYRLLMDQMSSPLVYVLLIASGVSFLLRDLIDGMVILLAVVVNTIFGFVQEYRAEKSMEALARLLTPKARVKRKGEWLEIEASRLVPGDVVKLTIGWKVPADGLLIVEDDMYLNEAILTGESTSIRKKTWKEDDEWKMTNGEFEKIENDFKGFMGTVVERGVGEMLVVKTGVKTRVGMIAKSVRETGMEKTPLQKRLLGLTKQLTLVVVVLAGVIFLSGLIAGRSPLALLNTSVALAVAAIPEGLVVGLTVILAVGMKRILKKKAIVRGLIAAETLGSVSVICLDKTGTITEGKMTAIGAVSDINESIDEQITDEGIHDKARMDWLIRGALVCNDLRDPLEISMRDWARGHPVFLKESELARVDELPFDHKRKYIVTRHEGGVEFLSGAPEVVLGLSVLSAAGNKKWMERFTTLGNRGYRMVAMAMKKLPTKETTQKIKREEVKGYEWLGLILFEDPVRSGVAESLQEAIGAGIRLKVITGDYKETAWACMRQAGLVEGDIVDEGLAVTGEELSKLSGDDKRRRINRAVLFARTSPEQKLEIVMSLQESGSTVGMMGDGVNDAPALKKADIGITVDGASDLAREVADLVLLDNNFHTILSSVEEGRGIFDNLRKVLLYLLSDSFSGIVVIFVSIVLGWPLPLLATQILWINLVSDGFPYMALTVEPKEDGLLGRKPVARNEMILDKKRAMLVGLISLGAGIFTLATFGWHYYILGSGLVFSRTIAFAMQGTASLFYVFSCRSLGRPIWKEGLFKNPALILAVVGGGLLQVFAIYNPLMQNIFGTVPLGLRDWFLIALAGVLMIGVIEMAKAVFFAERGRHNMVK